VQVEPNPFKGEVFQVRIASPAEVSAVLTILDLQGREIYSKSLALEKGRNEFSLPAGVWPKGAYLYRVETATETVSGKVIKN